MTQNYFSYALKNTLLVAFFCFISFFTGMNEASAQNCSPNAGPDQLICETDTLTLVGSVSGPNIGSEWIQVAGPSVIIDNPSSPITTISGYAGGNTYGFRIRGFCTIGGNNGDRVDITVQPITEAIISQGNIASCPSNGTIILNGSPPLHGETIEWAVQGTNNAGVSFSVTDQATTAITLPEDSCGITTIRYTITNQDALGPNLNCVSFDEITVTNYGAETMVDAGTDEASTQCYTATQSVALSASFGGCGLGGQGGAWSFVSGPSVPAFGNITANETTVSSLIEGTYTLRWTVSGPCVNGSDTVTLTIPEANQDITTAGATNNNFVFCDTSIAQTTLVGGEPNYSGETVEWGYNGSDPNLVIVDPTSPTTLVTGLDDGNSPYSFSYTITNDSTETSPGVGDACNSQTNVTVTFAESDPMIVPNGGNDIIGGLQ